MDFISEQKARIEHPLIRIVYPEGSDSRIIAGARRVADEHIAIPLLVGTEEELKNAAQEADVSLEGIECIDLNNEALQQQLVEKYSQETGFPEVAAKVLFQKPLGFGAALVRSGRADAMVAGIAHTTADVIQNCRQIIGMEEGIKTPSSMMVMSTPHYAAEEGHAVIFADPGVVPNPSAEELADIAIASARTTQRMLGWEPRVAMLSFSTKGSAKHPDAEKVIETLNIVRANEPDLLIDGEMQADAALVPSVAASKIAEESCVAGRANILVFPDLDAANICFKLVQRLGEAGAFGPFLQGFAKTASDLSRGSTPEDVVGVSVMAALEAQGRKQ